MAGAAGGLLVLLLVPAGGRQQQHQEQQQGRPLGQQLVRVLWRVSLSTSSSFFY